METSRQLTVLLELAEQLDIAIRAAPSGGGSDRPGGAVVRLRGRQVLFLDPPASDADKVEVVAEALRARDELVEMFLPPEIRELIEGAGGG